MTQEAKTCFQKRLEHLAAAKTAALTHLNSLGTFTMLVLNTSCQTRVLSGSNCNCLLVYECHRNYYFHSAF